MPSLNSTPRLRGRFYLLVLALNLLAAHVHAKLLPRVRPEEKPCPRHLRVLDKPGHTVSNHPSGEHLSNSLAAQTEQPHVGVVLANEQLQLQRDSERPKRRQWWQWRL